MGIGKLGPGFFQLHHGTKAEVTYQDFAKIVQGLFKALCPSPFRVYLLWSQVAPVTALR